MFETAHPALDPQRLEVTPLGLKEILAKQALPTLQLIDCREEEEWDLCRLDRAVLVPSCEFAELAPQVIQTDRPVVVY
jgi:rhodanese-related sulfurtransferase